MSTCMAVDGEVIEMNHRRRNRNAVRDVAILPPAVPEKAAALGTLDHETQVRAVSVMLTHAAMELAKATDAQSVLEWKAKAGAIQELTKQLKLGKEIRLDAEEFVRRTERALGIAIREGQRCGLVATNSSAARRRQLLKSGKQEVVNALLDLPSAEELAAKHELYGNDRKSGIYAMTDGVSDDQFNDALAEARSEGNLSRANVARKAKSKAEQTNPFPLKPEQEPPVPEPKRRLTKHDSTEMLANINGMLSGIVESLPFIDPSEIDATANDAVIKNIRKSMAHISALLKGINNG